MATGKITKEAVNALVAGPRDQFLWDDKLSGFGLKLTPAGSVVYILQYRMGGRGSTTQRYTIGAHGAWTPKTAKDEAERLLRLVDSGTDPAEEKRQREEQRRRDGERGFAAVAERFLADAMGRKRSRTDYERLLRLHVTPVLKSKALAKIRKADVKEAISRIPAEQLALRRKAHAVLHRLFKWAMGEDLIDHNPLADTEAPEAPGSRDHTLQDWELRLAWMGAGSLGYPFGPLYRGLVLTGQRREEVAGMDWRELNRARAVWSLPAERAKNGKAASIHLSKAMIAELDAVAAAEKWPRRGLVFSTTGSTPVSGYSRAKARLDAAMAEIAAREAAARGDESAAIEPWRTHDLRRTLATGMQRLGVRFEVVESILNHVSGSRSGVAGIYQRHDWAPEKVAALDAWAAHIERVVAGADETNVISFADRRA